MTARTTAALIFGAGIALCEEQLPSRFLLFTEPCLAKEIFVVLGLVGHKLTHELGKPTGNGLWTELSVNLLKATFIVRH